MGGGSLLSAVTTASEKKRERLREGERRDKKKVLVQEVGPSPRVEAAGEAESTAVADHRARPPKAFYGERWSSKIHGSLYSFFRSCWEQQRKDEGGGRSVFEDPFKTFKRQRHMFEWADKVRSDATAKGAASPVLRYFSFESPSPLADRPPRRVFLATTVARFWR